MTSDTAAQTSLVEPLVQAMAEATLLVNQDGRIVLANARALEAFGYARDELTGQPIDVLIPARFASHHGLLSRYMRDPRQQPIASGTTITGRRKDGTEIPCEISLSPYRHGDRWWVIASVRDITLRVAEAAQREMLARVAEATDEMIVIMDEAWRIEWVNRAFEEVTGYTLVEIKGCRPVDFLNAVASNAAAFRALDTAVANGEPATGELLSHTKAGRALWVSITARSVEIQGARKIISNSRDVTARKDAERQLQETQNRLRFALRETGTALVDWDVVANTVNDGWLSVIGYAPGLPADPVAAWRDLVYPDDIDEVWEALRAHIKGETRGFQAEYRMKNADGQWRWILDRGQAVGRDENGNAQRIVSVRVDIHERRQAADALCASEQTLAAILDGTPDTVAITRLSDGRIAYANPAISTMLGYTPKEILGKTVGDIDLWVRPEERDVVVAEIGRQRKLTGFETEFRTKEGKAIPVSLSYSLIEFGGDKSVITVARDITARKQAQRKLEASETRLRRLSEDLDRRVARRTAELAESLEYNRALFETSPVGLALSAMDGTLVDVNPAFAGIGGYAPSEVLGHDHHDFSPAAFHTQDEEVAERLRTNGRYTDVYKEFVHKDGHAVPVRCNGVLIERAGRPYVWSAVEDITEQQAGEARLREATARAERANRAKSAFLATMSHEIRTPMNGVIGMLEVLRETYLSADQNRMLDTMSHSAASLLRLIDDILDFSRTESDELRLEHAPVPILETVETVVAALAPAADKGSVAIKVFVEPALPQHIIGDAGRVRQILFNILGNAIKFARAEDGRAGRVSLRVQRQPGAVPALLFTITDNGIGMSPEQQTHIFEPFAQAETSTTRRYGGTGLGLSICLGLVRLMDGAITLDSRLGEGTEVAIRIPINGPPGMPPDERRGVLAGLHIAVAVQDHDNQAYLAEHVDYLGATSEIITDLEKLKARAEERAAAGTPFDLVVLGGLWNKGTKRRLRESFRADPVLRETRFVILSSRREHTAHADYPDAVVVSANPLRLSRFFEALATACGRAPQLPASGRGDESAMPSGGAGNNPGSAAAGQPGASILLVEDNPINQDVIVRQLELLGYSVEVAEDGVSALDMLLRKPHDLVLTDCFMPRMDGYELAQTIRRGEAGQAGPPVPIIAVTANVVDGAVEKCLAAGMNDCVPKPVELKVLKRTLAKWLPPGGRSPAGDHERPDTAPGAGTAPVDACLGPVDPGALARLLGDDPAAHQTILRKFAGETPRILAQIRAARHARAAGEVAAAAHKLKSSARAVGANALADHCEALETAGRDADWQTIDAVEARIGGLFTEVEQYISRSAPDLDG